MEVFFLVNTYFIYKFIDRIDVPRVDIIMKCLKI